MRVIEVVAAVICKEGKIFATQRGYGDYKDYWEFPGGKIEAGESPEAALIREINEELNTEICVEKFIRTVDYDYPEFHLTMHCYFCSIKSGNLELLEHEAAKWLTADNLNSVNWLPADAELLDDIRKESKNQI
jgi:ADP-ribose pyrophosphatase